MSEHAGINVADVGHDDLIRDARFSQGGDGGVASVVKTESWDSCFFGDADPRGEDRTWPRGIGDFSVAVDGRKDEVVWLGCSLAEGVPESIGEHLVDGGV